MSDPFDEPIAPAPTADAGANMYLHLRGNTVMQVPFFAIMGSIIQPAFSFQQDTNSGWYLDAVGKMGWVLNRYLFGYGEHVDGVPNFSLVDIHGVKGTLSHENTANREYKLPDAGGTLSVLSVVVDKSGSTLGGAINGSNTVFTTSKPIIEELDLQKDGVGNIAYTKTGPQEITLSVAPTGGSVLKFWYNTNDN